MYGKLHSTCFTGSMYGSSLAVFAVWGYAIACSDARGFVELNAARLADTFNCDPKELESAIQYLCQTDPRSRSKIEDGRRMVREGQFLYRIVNYETYRAMRDTTDRRDYQRQWDRQNRPSGYARKKIGLSGGSTAVRQSDVGPTAVRLSPTEEEEEEEGEGEGEGEGEQRGVKARSDSRTRGTGNNGIRLPVTSLPEDWRKFCKIERSDIDPDHTFAKFADHWRGKSGKDGRKSDWFATWRNWVRNERRQTPPAPAGGEADWLRHAI